MLETITQIEDLYRYNDWANARLFGMCQDLTNAQLDEKRELGLGSLRNTLFHLLAAEQIWLERWQFAPWRAFQTDSMGMAPDDIHAQLRQVSQSRLQMIKLEADSNFERIVTYKDAKGNEYANPLGILMLHVANHGVYHRAQALAYLKSLGRTVPVGLDYLLYKLARPTLDQPAESIQQCQAMGLQANVSPGWLVRWDGSVMQRYITYGQWATAQIVDRLNDIPSEALDHDYGLGHGSIRKTLVHLLNVERKWSAIMDRQGDAWQPLVDVEMAEIVSGLQEVYQLRLRQVAEVDHKSAQDVLEARPGGIKILSRRGEALVQLCCHGTHHRAQLVNMLRHSGRPVPPSDLIAWWRGLAP